MAGNNENNTLKIHWKFEYILSQIDPQKVKAISNLNDEALKLTMAGYVCEIVGGLKSIPAQAHKAAFAKALIKQGKTDSKKIAELTGLTPRAVWNYQKGQKDD